MKAKRSIASLLLGLGWFLGMPSHAEQVATVTEDNLNVRGKPSFSGEVITQLHKGEQVVVLEQITLTKPNPGEPAEWSRIRLPANTPVWVFAPFVDATAHTINVTRLNVRAGPGENYSVMGRLERGEIVTPIRTVDDWMEIEPPASAEAYVAKEYLALQKPAEPVPAAVPTPAPIEPEAVPPESVPLIKLVPAAVIAAPVETVIPEPETIQPAPALQATENGPARVPVPIVPAPPPIIIEAKPDQINELQTEPRRRIVRREGVLRSSRSIQAPTYFELVNQETGKVIDFLDPKRSEIDLKEFKGRAVVVSGEEGIAPRWPKTPVLLVETLELIP
jgi:hypothetical protein